MFIVMNAIYIWGDAKQIGIYILNAVHVVLIVSMILLFLYNVGYVQHFNYIHK
jgi:hypothetical protein